MGADKTSDARPVLVTGANGFVGRNLCRHLTEGGWQVRGAVRGTHSSPASETITVGDIDGETDWREALQGVAAVVHCAARVHVLEETAADPLAAFRKVNVAGSEKLARQARDAGVKHFVFLSSIGARIAEDGDDVTPYQRSKLEAERVLKEMTAGGDMALTSLRPPLIYGRDAPGNFALLVKVIERGLPLPLASVRNARTFLYIGNLCDAIRSYLETPDACRGTYEIADGPGVSTPDLIRELAGVLGRPARLWPCPVWTLRLAGRLSGRSMTVERLTESLDIDMSPLMQDLNWSPPWDLRAGLTASFVADRKTGT